MSRVPKINDQWQKEYNTLFNRVPCYLTVIDKNFKIVRANDAFRDNFSDPYNRHCYEIYKRRKSKCLNCPAEKTFKDGKVHRSHQQGIGKHNQKIYYIVTTSSLIKEAKTIDYVIEISSDITPMKKLEEKVIEQERLGAVGQTVAGLAHSIKNILMGLEGGKYIVSLGLKKNNKDMINQGWEMLERNFDKTTSLVKDFLSFSKGRLPELKMVNPVELVWEIIDLYKDVAARSGIKLTPIIDEKINPVPLDKAGIHTCLTNLVSNAIDACLMSEHKGTEVAIKISEIRKKLVFEVQDNGSGIDYEIKKKIFTTFFTTKGGGGTGLGLLTTRKIVEEHGGKLSVVSQKGKGANFKMEFLRKRLMELYKVSQK
jgi:signal transduction histidine kinase